MCNIEFPHFGASYPDAHCINGYLWDMDSYENGCYTIGGDDPCPFCNTDAWLKTVLDNEEFASREEALEWVEKMREKWGAEHSGSSEIPKDLEEAATITLDEAEGVANEYTAFLAKGLRENQPRPIGPHWFCEYAKNRFIAGAKWQADHTPLPEDTVLFNKGVEEGKRLMMDEAVEGRVISNDGISFPVSNEIHRLNLMEGDKVRVIVLKKED